VDVLDLFAGAGSLGIEALSRGARRCVFVEQDRQVLRCLRQNIEHLEIGAMATILADNAWTTRVPQFGASFGLIFVDPPYRDAQNSRRIVDLLDRLAAALAADGLIAFRCAATSPALPSADLRALHVVDERMVGRMRLVLLARAGTG
jgi:16S rRNA (guanine966-N2)-methyltransferase